MTRWERRDVLRLSAVGGVASALTLGSVSFARAADGSEESRTVRGHLPTGAPDFVHLPVEVPAGVREISVSYSCDKPTVPEGTQGNALDIGIFDERGTALGGRGFRGWSGGARDRFTI
ncbi:MAG TPA: twin-arginine translocation signal domain-containing protein, partial [Streptomyces sp.]|nr:twin-arginine translocation signal domain-containing protein [Streptomyces sp.]